MEEIYSYCDVSVKLVLSGRFRVTLLTKEKIKDDVLTHVVSETVVENEQAAEVEFPYTFADAKGMYTFMLTGTGIEWEHLCGVEVIMLLWQREKCAMSRSVKSPLYI